MRKRLDVAQLCSRSLVCETNERLKHGTKLTELQKLDARRKLISHVEELCVVIIVKPPR
jgi:hypothetical protein